MRNNELTFNDVMLGVFLGLVLALLALEYFSVLVK